MLYYQEIVCISCTLENSCNLEKGGGLQPHQQRAFFFLKNQKEIYMFRSIMKLSVVIFSYLITKGAIVALQERNHHVTKPAVHILTTRQIVNIG